MDDATRERLTAYLTDRTGSDVIIERLAPLTGGAVQENWLLDIDVARGEWAGRPARVFAVARR